MDKQDFKGIIPFKTAEDYNSWRAGTFTKGGEDFPAYNRNILAVLPDEQSQYVETGIEGRVEQLEKKKIYKYTWTFYTNDGDYLMFWFYSSHDLSTPDDNFSLIETPQWANDDFRNAIVGAQGYIQIAGVQQYHAVIDTDQGFRIQDGTQNGTVVWFGTLGTVSYQELSKEEV